MNKFLYFKKSPLALTMAIVWFLPMAVFFIDIDHSGIIAFRWLNAALAFLNITFWFYVYRWLKTNYYLRITDSYLIINSSFLKTRRKYFFYNIKSFEKKPGILVLNLNRNKKIKIFFKALSAQDQKFLETDFMTMAGKFISA